MLFKNCGYIIKHNNDVIKKKTSFHFYLTLVNFVNGLVTSGKNNNASQVPQPTCSWKKKQVSWGGAPDNPNAMGPERRVHTLDGNGWIALPGLACPHRQRCRSQLRDIEVVEKSSSDDQPKTWSTQLPSLPASVSNQWVPLFGESPPTHLVETHSGEKLNKYNQCDFEETLYDLHDHHLPGSERRSAMCSASPGWLSFCMVVPEIEKGFFKHMPASSLLHACIIVCYMPASLQCYMPASLFVAKSVN